MTISIFKSKAEFAISDTDGTVNYMSDIRTHVRRIKECGADKLTAPPDPKDRELYQAYKTAEYLRERDWYEATKVYPVLDSRDVMESLFRGFAVEVGADEDEYSHKCINVTTDLDYQLMSDLLGRLRDRGAFDYYEPGEPLDLELDQE